MTQPSQIAHETANGCRSRCNAHPSLSHVAALLYEFQNLFLVFVFYEKTSTQYCAREGPLHVFSRVKIGVVVLGHPLKIG